MSLLPMISSVTLTQGAVRMALREVIVKHLPAIQNFGSIDILCSDKTGTLTAGMMQFDRSLDPTGAASPRPLTLAYINGRFETGIRSPLDAAILQQPAVDMSGYRRSTKSRSISSGAACPWWWRRRTALAAGCSSPRVRLTRSSPCPRRSKPEVASRRSTRQ